MNIISWANQNILVVQAIAAIRSAASVNNVCLKLLSHAQILQNVIRSYRTRLVDIMSMLDRRYKVEIPEDLKRTVVVNFKAAPRTMEKVHRYAATQGISLAEACRIALDRLGDDLQSPQN